MTSTFSTLPTSELPVTAADIDVAFERLQDVVTRTPIHLSERLCAATGANVWLKREDLQPVRSYKIRGAYNHISQMTPEQRKAGVVCASAGNHGQGVALACATLGVHGAVYVPSTTPRQKRERIVALGNGAIELVVVGDTYDDSYRHAVDAVERTGMSMVPAFDDPRTIAGQGTVAREIVEQLGRAPDLVIVPVGGGGMIAGILTWLAENCPKTRVLGIEPAGATCMQAALEAGEPVELADIDRFVDGAAVRKAGAIPFEIAARHRLELKVVPEGVVCSEMLELYQVDGIIAEPAGALATAVFGQWKPAPGSIVVSILSGGNNDVSRYAEIIERALIYEGRKHYFLVNFPQEPGALRRFLDEVLGPNDDITFFEYVKRSNREHGPALVGIELQHRDDIHGLRERMNLSNIEAEPIDPESSMFRFLNA
jgi:threonine dehydratase